MTRIWDTQSPFPDQVDLRNRANWTIVPSDLLTQEADPSAAADVEPYWMACIGVDDVDSAAEKARELGGHVLLPPTKVPGFGRAAVLRDPQGRAFGIFTPAP